ncbi:chromosome partitioning protein ParB [Ralstonia solanacearum]|nr:chromosome partitioning protein ParB [Ralstonia solanacearum]
MDPSGKIVMIPIEAITVVNPRIRNQKLHQEITENIRKIGLKRPITVRLLANSSAEYALVCGQGRLESYKMLGQTEIPAIVLDADEQTGQVMSVVENVARRMPRTAETLSHVATLKQRGYSDAEIGKKIGCSASWVANVVTLLENGEKRLLSAAESGHIPLHVAVDISRASDTEAQQILLDAYESGELKGKKVSVVRRILEQRARIGRRGTDASYGRTNARKKLSPEMLAKLYQEDVERHRLIQKKAEYTQNSLLVVCQIFKELLALDAFVDLLKDENLASLPQPLLASTKSGSPL